MSQLPIPLIPISQVSNSSAVDDESLDYHLDNVDFLDTILKNCDQHREEKEIKRIINDIIKNDYDKEFFKSTLYDLCCSNGPETNGSYYQTRITVLSKESFRVKGPDIQNINQSIKNESYELIRAFDNKLMDMRLDVIQVINKYIRKLHLICVYCHNSTCIFVNGKQLALHILEMHRFTTLEVGSYESVVNILKSNLNYLENIYLNTDNFNSTNELSHKHASFNNKFYCFICQYTSRRIKEINFHRRSVHSSTKYHCIMCKITLSNYGELHCHLCPGADLGVCQYLSFRCLFCNESKLHSAFRFMIHLRKAHITCEFCLKTFLNQQSLALHVNKHKTKHVCLKCNITYYSKKDIFQHLFWKHNRDSKECKLCLTKKWPSTYHFCVPPKIFTCDKCKRTFTKPLQLRVHQRWHTGNILYECNTCHNKFISKKLLQKHKLIHEELTKADHVYNRTLLNLSSVSDSENTAGHKLDKCLKLPYPNANDYWDYISKQRKELVRISLFALQSDHNYTLLPTMQPEIINTPQYLDESIDIVKDYENCSDNSLYQKSPNCNSLSSSSSSWFLPNDYEEKEVKPTVKSPKRYNEVFNAKKIKNFNLHARESDLESEFSNTDNEEFYDINLVPLHPLCNYSIDKNVKQQPKKRKLVVNNSSDEDQISNKVSIITQIQEHKPQSQIQYQNKTIKLTKFQKTKPVEDTKISKSFKPPIYDKTNGGKHLENLEINQHTVNKDSFIVRKCTPYKISSIKQKRNTNLKSPKFQSTSKLTKSQKTRRVVDAKISKGVEPLIVLPRLIEQKTVESTETLYCYCRRPYDETLSMIACDKPNCPVEWFHFDCVGITEVDSKENWYCPDCL